jgi:hypothetical protein
LRLGELHQHRGVVDLQRKLGFALLGGGILGVLGAAIIEPLTGSCIGVLLGASIGYAYAVLNNET